MLGKLLSAALGVFALVAGLLMLGAGPAAAVNPLPLYVPQGPSRLMDTRADGPTVDGLGPKGAIVGPGFVTLQIGGRAGYPASGLGAVQLNVTVTSPSADSHLRVWPAGFAMPTASNLNFVAGQTFANSAVTRTSADGRVNIYLGSGTAHVLVDVEGYYPLSDMFVGVNPARLLDTRPGQPTIDGLGPKGLLTGPTSIDLDILGRGGVAASGVSAVVMSVAATQSSTGGHLRVWPTASAMPNASVLNFPAGRTVPNLVVAKLGKNGRISIYLSGGTAHLFADVMGYYLTSGDYIPLQPARLMDTRGGGTIDGQGPVGAFNGVNWLKLTTRGGTPLGAGAVVLNVTVINPTGAGHLTIWRVGTAEPIASNINFAPGQTVANQVLADVSTTATYVPGSIIMRIVGGPAHVVVDVVGALPPAFSGPLTQHTQTLTAGGSHSCAMVSGAVRCWGYNGFGQLGDGTSTNRSTPVAVPGLAGVVAVTAGDRHTCALLDSTAVYCWGSNADGQLGDGTFTSSKSPVLVTGLPPIVEVSAGGAHTCALTRSGRTLCWGANASGQLGDGTSIDRPSPTTVLGVTGTSTLALGDDHSCAIAGEWVACWGSNASGQLGDGTTTSRNTAVPTLGSWGGMLSPGHLVAGSSHTCAWNVISAKCWGLNSSGQLGDGTLVNRIQPAAMTLPGRQVFGAAGSNHTCAFEDDGAASCWGWNYFGQLGDGTTTGRLTPTAVSGLTSTQAMAAGWNHTCAVANGHVRCWGDNTYGQLGDSTTTDRSAPVIVSGL